MISLCVSNSFIELIKLDRQTVLNSTRLFSLYPDENKINVCLNKADFPHPPVASMGRMKDGLSSCFTFSSTALCLTGFFPGVDFVLPTIQQPTGMQYYWTPYHTKTKSQNQLSKVISRIVVLATCVSHSWES
jgi:hypothetical protein